MKENKQIKGQIDEMLKNEIIELSISLYAFNIIIVRKKDGISKGINRMYINFALFNEIIKKNSKQFYTYN